jgi:hypothetical protein
LTPDGVEICRHHVDRELVERELAAYIVRASRSGGKHDV